jgi:nucleoside-diphosphate-sugar epimerase
MKILVIGATGFVGSAVAAHLKKQGLTVLGLARGDTQAQRLTDAGITPVRGDLADPASLKAAAQGADGVIHAGAISFSAGNMAEVLAQMGVAQAALIDALAGTQKPLVVTSGSAIYGDTGETLAVETDALPPIPHFAGWRQSEADLLAASSKGVRAMLLRLTVSYGHSGAGVGPVLKWIETARELGRADYVGTGENALSAVHVDDLADLYALALEKGVAGEIYNAAAGAPYKTRDIMRAVGKAAGVTGEGQSISPQDAFTRWGMVGGLAAGNMRISGAKAQRDLGWSPSQPTLIKELTNGSYAS